jgi:hypothetical protein
MDMLGAASAMARSNRLLKADLNSYMENLHLICRIPTANRLRVSQSLLFKRNNHIPS